MIFESLYESALKNQLILIDGGFCRWYQRNDGQITIREIISIDPGAGTEMLKMLKRKKCHSIYARCPADLESNEWYAKKGFVLEGTYTTEKGRLLNCWRLWMTPKTPIQDLIVECVSE